MNLNYTPEELEFRKAVREFLEAQLPADIRDKLLGGRIADADDIRRWQRILHARGWGGSSWPAQFGGQALQHRMVDMLTHVEQARSMAYLAASRCESEDPTERAASLLAAKVIIGQAARFVGQQAVQLHGGMGLTDELGVSHYFKRLLAAAARFGSTETHLERYAQTLTARTPGCAGPAFATVQATPEMRPGLA
jgi:alkylation response protein AidB-like acyl-CoA dehydrogenase